MQAFYTLTARIPLLWPTQQLRKISHFPENSRSQIDKSESGSGGDKIADNDSRQTDGPRMMWPKTTTTTSNTNI